MTARGSAYLLQFALLFQLLFAVVFAQDGQQSGGASDDVKSIFDSADGIKVGGTIIAVLAILVGVVICFAGYKLFKPTLFIIAFVLGGVVVAMIAEEIFENKSWFTTASWIAFAVGGIIVAGIVIALYSLSIFVAGATAGVVLAMLINPSFGYKIFPSHPTVIFIILAVVLGILGGVLALMLEKPVLIIATALIGAGLFVWGIGYFAGDFPSPSDLKRFATKDANGDWNYSIPSAWWGYLAGILVLALFGMLVQFGKTGRGITHTRKQRKGQGVHGNHAVPPHLEEQPYAEARTPQDGNGRFVHPMSHA